MYLIDPKTFDVSRSSKSSSRRMSFPLSCACNVLDTPIDRSKCDHWNRVHVNKIFLEKSTLEPKVNAYIPLYEPLEIVKYAKCKQVIAEPKELIRRCRSGLDAR